MLKNSLLFVFFLLFFSQGASALISLDGRMNTSNTTGIVNGQHNFSFTVNTNNSFCTAFPTTFGSNATNVTFTLSSTVYQLNESIRATDTTATNGVGLWSAFLPDGTGNFTVTLSMNRSMIFAVECWTGVNTTTPILNYSWVISTSAQTGYALNLNVSKADTVVVFGLGTGSLGANLCTFGTNLVEWRDHNTQNQDPQGCGANATNATQGVASWNVTISSGRRGGAIGAVINPDTTPAGDSCTYPGSGNWNVALDDHCVLSSSAAVYPNNVTLSGTGSFTIASGGNLDANKIFYTPASLTGNNIFAVLLGGRFSYRP